MSAVGGRPRIVVISLGGTIASTNAADRSNSAVSPELNASDLVSALPQLHDVADIEAIAFRTVPSGELTMADMVELASMVDGLAATVTGVVVTQGTDTIEETSFALDLLVKGARPVVVTGAMRNPTVAGTDGPANLLAAVRVASAPVSVGLGTLVVMNDEIHAARFVRKSHATSTATFQSPSSGPIGWLVEGQVRVVFDFARLPLIAVEPGATIPAVALLTAALGDDARLLGSIESVGYAGLVIEGFGGGHLPGAVATALSRLSEQMPVVLASRTGAGELLRATYGFAGSETDLMSRGLISAGVFDGRKARVALSLMLGARQDIPMVRSTFGGLNLAVQRSGF